MNQLLLDLEPPSVPTFDDFVVGRNAEALAALRLLATTTPADPSARCLYLWGEDGSGRTHLATAASRAMKATHLDGRAASAGAIRDAAAGAAGAALVIDDVEALDAQAQEALFHAVNRLREDPAGRLVATGNAAPRGLLFAPGRDDLRSRLSWGLVHRLHRLDDDEKDAALVHRAKDRGFPLAPEVRRYLMTHFTRDLGSLMRMVDALDRHGREHGRLVTVPLIRDFLRSSIDFPSVRDEPADRPFPA